MARHPDPQSPSESWDDGDDEESEEFLGASFFPPMHNRLLTSEILGNALRAHDLRVALEALAKYTNDQTIGLVNQDLLPPGWDDAKEFIAVVLQTAMDKFYRMDAFLRVHQEYPDQLFACLYFLSYACTGLTAVVAESSLAFGDVHDQELCGLLNATYSMLDSRAALYTLPCVRQLPNLDALIERTEQYLLAQLPGPLSSGESDDEVAEATEGVIHLRNAVGANQWQAYLVQLLLGTGFLDNAVKIINAPRFHTMQLHSALLGTLVLIIQLLANVVRQQLNQERRQAVERGLAQFLTWVDKEVLADPEKLFNARDRSSQCLSASLASCHELMEELQLPNTQLTVVQRQVVIEMLKSSNFSRLLSAVQECRSLLNYSSRRSSQMVDGNADPDVVGIEENVRWLDQERIVKQMLRVNLHQSQYVDAVLGILRVLAECGHFNDEHLDMLWGVTEQEDTFDAVKTNVCHMIKQLAQHLRPQQLDLLFSKFENRKGRTLPDTLRLLDLLRRLAQSDTKKASSMAGKLVELVWELTTPVDAPPELLNSSVMLDVLEGYKQHALLQKYIQRCIAQLRTRTNVYTALTVLQNLLRLWGKLYGWEARREERRSGGPLPLCELLANLDRESSSGSPPLSRLLVENLCDFMTSAARWLEERRPQQPAATAAPSASGATAGPGPGPTITQQPPGQGSYSYQQIVRRYLDVFRLVSQCKDTYTELRLVEALWDTVVLRPNTPEDMPSGLDLVLACAGEVDDDSQAAAAADGMVTASGPLLEPRDLCKLLEDRVTRLPVENLAQPAFNCFKACLQAALEESARGLAALPHGHPARNKQGEMDEEAVRIRGRDYLWQIVLDCQRGEVTASASDMLINEVYGKEGIHNLISDTRTRLMDAAALLTSAPPGTVEWDHVELPPDVMESSRWEQARTRATRCMQLLEQLAGKSEESMPPVPMHSASWQGPSLLLEVTTPEQGRIKIACTANEYVGLLRRKVAQRLGVEAACVRLIVGGQELRSDGRTLQSALPPTWSARQTLLAQISPCTNRYTRFGEEWWAAWHRSSTLAHMYHDDQLYRVLLLLADLPKAPGVRAAACRLLQQLPTCSWVPGALLEALLSEQPAAQLRLQLLGLSGGVDRPGLLLYTLQALYALLQPSYPADLLPLVYKLWQQSPQHQQQAAIGEGDASAHQQHQPEVQHVSAGAQALCRTVATGSVADRLLPVLAKCVPLLADVVDKVMAPVAGAAGAATAAAGIGTTAAAASGGTIPSGVLDACRQAAMQPAADLTFVKDFQWVMVFLLCNIYQRSRRGPSLDGRAPLQGAAAAAARAQPADSLSSSHGHEHPEAAPSGTAATHPQGPYGRQGHPQHPQHQEEPPRTQGPAASGGQDSEAVTQEAAPQQLYNGGGGGGAATPEITSADPEACASTQMVATQEGGDSALLQPTCGSGPAATAAALVSGLAVSSRGSPDVHHEAGREPAASSHMEVSVAGGAAPAGATGVHSSSRASPPPKSPSPRVPVCGSSTDVEMMPVQEHSQQLPPAALSQQLPAAVPSPGAVAMSVSMSQPATATVAPQQRTAGPSSIGAGDTSNPAPGGGDGHANLMRFLGQDGVRCLVSLLVRMAYDAGRLWGYGTLLMAQQQAGPGRQVLGGVKSTAAAAGVPTCQQMSAAADVACRLAGKALQVLTRLVQWTDLRDAFLEDPRAVPMLLETLSCVFSPAIREHALNYLEGVFPGTGNGQMQLPARHYMWALTSLVSLRPAMEHRLDSCLEFHFLLGKVIHQLPELAAPSADARLLADSVLSEEVTRLDVGAEELLEPRRGLLLRGKLMLVRELVRALERLGLGLGANGRPGLISLLLNRYLFPEAQPLWQPDVSCSDMEVALQHVAADGAVRREALHLVQFLMTACPRNLEQGFRDLSRLHYDYGLRAIDRKFDISGDGVRQSEDCYVGLRNGGATCYMNSVMQQLFMQPRIRELVLQAGAVDPEEHADSVFHQLQVMFAHLRLGRASCYNPRGFWNSFKDYDGQPIDVREHQDAYEFFTRLQDSVDSYLRATGQTPAMQAVMGGKFAAQIICKDVNYRSEREEEFYQISVEVKGFHSLEKSLENYVAGELMEGDNSYYCEELGARVSAVRRTVIKELPHTLVIHLKRFEYDHLNMTRYKLRDRFEFPVVLDMFKYTADGLAALEATGSNPAAPGAAAPGAAGAAGSGQEGSDGARSRNCYLYELKGIVVHSGTAFAGHYYSFIKERPRLQEDGQVTEGSWNRFDDKVITPWNIQDLDADCFGGRPVSNAGGGGRADAERPYSAYMLFYERRDAPSYDRPAADMRTVPRDLVIAAAASPIPTPNDWTGEEGRSGRQQAPSGPSGQQDAGGAGGSGAADDMDTDGPQPPQPGQGHQPQQRAASGPVRGPEPAVITTPYGMPVLLYQNVLRENLLLMHKLHVLNKEYFGFVRQVVEVTWETVLAGRKTRRRDLHHHHHPHPHTLAAANGHGSGSVLPRSQGGSGPAATAGTASGGTTASGGAESSSAPSQRNEELDETVLLSARLAAAFLLNVYMPAPAALRSDLAAWEDMMRHMLQASPRACVELIRIVGTSAPLQSHYFVRSGQDGQWLVEILKYALEAAGRAAAAAAASAAAAPTAGDDPAAGAAAPAAPPPPQQQPAPLQQQLQSACLELTVVLCDLVFGAMHDQQRSDPQHLPVCNALADLVAADPACAYVVLSGHLTDAFALPGYMLTDPGDATEADMLPELAASLRVLHALMQHCYHTCQNTPLLTVRIPVRAPGDDRPGVGGRLPAAPHAAGGGGVVRLDLTGQLDELVAQQDSGVFEAALAHSGLLNVGVVQELLQFLMACSGQNSLRFLNILLTRLADAEHAGASLVEMVEALPAVLDVPDWLRPNRFYVLIFGTAHGQNQGTRSCLARLAANAVQRQQGLSWHGLVVATAMASLWTGSEAARTVIRSSAPQALAGLVQSMAALVRQLNDFVQSHAERASAAAAATGSGAAGAAGAAAREAAAALTARARRVATVLNNLVQTCLPLIQTASAQQLQHSVAAAQAPQHQQPPPHQHQHQQQPPQQAPQQQHHSAHQQQQQQQQTQQQPQKQPQLRQQPHPHQAVHISVATVGEADDEDADGAGARGPVRVEEVEEEEEEVGVQGRVYGVCAGGPEEADVEGEDEADPELDAEEDVDADVDGEADGEASGPDIGDAEGEDGADRGGV